MTVLNELNTAALTATPKGHRIWIQGIAHLGPRFDIEWGEHSITLWFGDEGKRKVSPSKGGIIDLQSKRVTRWARGATTVRWASGYNALIIFRGDA